MKKRKIARYGWKRDLPDHRDRVFQCALNIVDLPPMVNLAQSMPLVYNQLSIGSCHDENTEILTKNGWKLFSEINLTDELASVNPQTSELIFEKPIRIIKNHYNGDLICADRRSLNFKVTPNHKMLVRKWNEEMRALNNEYVLIDAENVGWYAGLMNRIVWNGLNQDTYQFKGIPDAKRKVNRMDLHIPMIMWLKFLGLYLAEGTALKEKNKIQIAASKEREKSYARNLFLEMNVIALELPDRFTFNNKAIHNELIKLGLFGIKAPFKFVPDFVFEQSSSNIESFLEGHFMGDGCEGVNRSHYTSSYKLANDLQRLIFMTGNESYISMRGPRTSKMNDGRIVIGKYPEYRVSVCENKNLSINRNIDIFREFYEGYVFCAEVPTYHTLVTRRNNCILISGNCTANSISAAIEFDILKQKTELDFMPSRLFIYYNERFMEGTVNYDSGAQIRDGIKSVNQQGVCPEVMWAYDPKLLKKKPTPECYQIALTNLVSSYHSIPQDLVSMKTCLAEGYPFVFGFSVYDSFESDEVANTGIVNLPDQSEGIVGGHAVVCVAYDDATQRFLVRNSWGADWGQGGNFTIPYEYLTNPNLASDFWTIRVVE
jgi:intein/homing endonuclease